MPDPARGGLPEGTALKLEGEGGAGGRDAEGSGLRKVCRPGAEQLSWNLRGRWAAPRLGLGCIPPVATFPRHCSGSRLPLPGWQRRRLPSATPTRTARWPRWRRRQRSRRRRSHRPRRRATRTKMRSSPTSVGSPLCPPLLQSLGIVFVSRPSPSVGAPCLQAPSLPPLLRGAPASPSWSWPPSVWRSFFLGLCLCDIVPALVLAPSSSACVRLSVSSSFLWKTCFSSFSISFPSSPALPLTHLRAQAVLPPLSPPALYSIPPSTAPSCICAPNAVTHSPRLLRPTAPASRPPRSSQPSVPPPVTPHADLAPSTSRHLPPHSHPTARLLCLALSKPCAGLRMLR